MNEPVISLLRLLLAHVVVDFLMQPTDWVAERNLKHAGSKYLYLHAGLHAAGSYLALFQYQYWWLIPVIFISHFFIDFWKSYRTEPKALWLLIDQALHVLVIFFIWAFFIEHKTLSDIGKHTWNNKEFLIRLLALYLVSQPASILISQGLEKWSKALSPQSQSPATQHTSLLNAGKWIGYLERILILVFVFLKTFEPIGFLLAAKSVFRFGELKDDKEKNLTEYVLIGTLMSFGIAIMVGLAANYILVG
jgi:hypothetical protein